MTNSPPQISSESTDEVARRQLAMLSELAAMSLVVARGAAAASVAASHAVEVILADRDWQAETGRARALAGAKDAADAFQKVSRTLRLTLMLEKTAVKWARDIRAGVVFDRKKDAGETRAVQLQPWSVDRRRPAGSCSVDRADADPRERDFEGLVEFDRADRLPHGSFEQIVERIRADLGLAAKDAGGPPAVQDRAFDSVRRRPAGSSSDKRADAERPDLLIGEPFRKTVTRLWTGIDSAPSGDQWSAEPFDLQYTGHEPDPEPRRGPCSGSIRKGEETARSP